MAASGQLLTQFAHMCPDVKLVTRRTHLSSRLVTRENAEESILTAETRFFHVRETKPGHRDYANQHIRAIPNVVDAKIRLHLSLRNNLYENTT